MHDKSILLIISGGIAAYKSLDLIRRLREQGAKVRCVVTAAATEFVTPLSVAALSEEPVFTDLFDLKNETEIGHIRLSREADLIIVAPATADLIAKMVHGICDDLASTVLLASDKPVLVAPAMNWRMWEHPATKRNVAQLRLDGVHFAGPDEGSMACGEFGFGRMAEVGAIVEAAQPMLNEPQRLLEGYRVLVTAGPTFEPIDPVRYIGNRSSGKQGYAIAAAAARFGAHVKLVAGPGSLSDPMGVEIIHVETAETMFDAVKAALPVDAAIFTAAVGDWRTAAARSEKIKKGPGGTPQLHLVENPDILQAISQGGTNRPRLVIGFAAETENVIENAQTKLRNKGCDWIVANNVSGPGGAFASDRNTVHLIKHGGVESWPAMSKDLVAKRLMIEAAAALAQNPA